MTSEENIAAVEGGEGLAGGTGSLEDEAACMHCLLLWAVLTSSFLGQLGDSPIAFEHPLMLGLC